MVAGPESDDPFVAAAFLQRCLADRAAGGLQPLETYLAIWPDHRDQIEREWRALAGGESAEEERDADRIGPYRVVSELGRGGQGVVYLAEDPRLKRRVALKVLSGLGPGSEALLARFRREAEVASKLDHPGICGVLESGLEGSRAWIAMRHVEGTDLARAIKECSAPPRSREDVAACLELFEKLARALHAAHEAGIVHRDIKPGNVIVTPEGEPVLLDFGLARDEDPELHSLTATGDVFGTPAYMSPEQLSGRGPRLDRRTDVYSLGVALFERLTLAPPFRAPTREALYHAILTEEPPDVRRDNPALSKDASVVLATALAKDRDRRYQAAADLAEDLRRLRAREPILARPAGPLVKASRWVQRNPVVSALAFGLFAALLGGLLLTAWLLRSSETTRSELAEANLQLEAQLEDVLAGRRSRLERRIEELVDEGWHDAVGASTGRAPALFEEVLALDPSNKQALVGRVWCETPDFERALAVLDRHGGVLGGDPDVVWLRAFLLEQEGRGVEAEALRRAAGERDSDVRLYLRGLRRADNFMTFDAAKARAAHELFQRAVVRSETPRFHYHHAVLMSASLARDKEAMEQAARDLEYHWPDAPNTWDAVAQFFLPLDPERAERAMRRSYELEPAAAPCCGLAHVATLRGDLALAREWLDRAVEVEPEFAPAWYLRGDLALRGERTAEARADFLEAVGRDPRYPPSYDGLAAVHARLGDLERAREDWRAIAERHPGQAEALLRLAALELAEGDVETACTHYARAAGRAPADPRPLREWRRALESRGDLASAAAELRAFARGHPASYVARAELARLLAAAGRREDAIAAYEEALAIHPDEDLRRELDELR